MTGGGPEGHSPLRANGNGSPCTDAPVETSWEKRDLLPTPDRVVVGVAIRFLQ